MDYDDLLNIVGPFGKYQKLVILLVLQPALFPCGFLLYNALFLAATPADYWCSLPTTVNTSTADLRASILPPKFHHDKNETSKCSMYDFNDTYYEATDFDQFNTSLSNFSSSEVSCKNGWEFDRSVYQETIVTEFSLVCDKDLAATWSFAVASFGGVIGTLGWGFLADRWGRKPTFFAVILFQSVFSVATGFSPNFMFYCACRFLVGTTLSFSYSLPYLLSTELTGTDTRVIMSIICSAGYTLSVMVVTGIAYGVRTWRMLNLASAVPLVCLLALWQVFPESPRWLLAQGRYEELEAFIRKLARINKRPLPKDIDKDLPRILEEINVENQSDSKEKHSLIDLFRTPNMRKKTMILIFMNFCNVGVFSGLNFYAPAFGADPHLNTVLSALVEFPPYLFASYVCNKFGRRASLVVSMALGAVSCLAAVGLRNPDADSSYTTVMTLSLITKFFITLTFMIGELLEQETFPTTVRGEGASLTIIVASIAGCGSPFIVHLGHDLLVLPLAIFGTLCLFASVTALFLPETLGTDLPQTLAEGEAMGKDMPWKEILSIRLPRRIRKSEIEQQKISEDRVKDAMVRHGERPNKKSVESKLLLNDSEKRPAGHTNEEDVV